MAVVLAQQGAGLQVEEDEEPPELPDEVAYLWQFWLELHAGRSSGGFGVNPLSYSDIQAWSALTDEPLDPWEVRALRAVDTVYLVSFVKKSSAAGD
jgi:hypothetical protein